MSSFFRVLIALVFVTSVSSCAVFMAAGQPDKKDIELFKVGTPRSMLLAEFGLPTVTEVREDGKRYEIYTFTQGYSKGAKAGRAVLHGTADVLTLGLWEVIGTPTESTFDGSKMAYEVRYNSNNLIDQIVLLKSE